MRQRLAREKENERKIHIHSFFLFFWLSSSTIFETSFNILRYEVRLSLSMIATDNLQAGQIQRKLQSKQFILIKKEKANHELWNNDISLIGQINTDGAQEILEGWAQSRTGPSIWLRPGRTGRNRIFASSTSKMNRPDFDRTGPEDRNPSGSNSDPIAFVFQFSAI